MEYFSVRVARGPTQLSSPCDAFDNLPRLEYLRDVPPGTSSGTPQNHHIFSSRHVPILEYDAMAKMCGMVVEAYAWGTRTYMPIELGAFSWVWG